MKNIANVADILTGKKKIAFIIVILSIRQLYLLFEHMEFVNMILPLSHRSLHPTKQKC